MKFSISSTCYKCLVVHLKSRIQKSCPRESTFNIRTYSKSYHFCKLYSAHFSKSGFFGRFGSLISNQRFKRNTTTLQWTFEQNSHENWCRGPKSFGSSSENQTVPDIFSLVVILRKSCRTQFLSNPTQYPVSLAWTV